jgi:hypothetical protein
MRNDTKETIDRYVSDGVPTGDFLRAVFENNLMEAFGRADIDNRHSMFEICSYIYNNCPSICWGSKKQVQDWIAHQGFKGLNEIEEEDGS